MCGWSDVGKGWMDGSGMEGWGGGEEYLDVYEGGWGGVKWFKTKSDKGGGVVKYSWKNLDVIYVWSLSMKIRGYD